MNVTVRCFAEWRIAEQLPKIIMQKNTKEREWQIKNQDKNQSKNRAEQAEEHDESVLNPEIKNESDLSKKERRLIEKEKLKGNGGQKKKAGI